MAIHIADRGVEGGNVLFIGHFRRERHRGTVSDAGARATGPTQPTTPEIPVPGPPEIPQPGPSGPDIPAPYRREGDVPQPAGPEIPAGEPAKPDIVPPVPEKPASPTPPAPQPGTAIMAPTILHFPRATARTGGRIWPEQGLPQG